MSIAESLQEFAKRKRQPIERAYPAWHQEGNATASAWREPFASRDTNGDDVDHVIIAGGKSLGLTAADVRLLAKAGQ